MTTIKTLSAAALGAVVALLGSRLPIPDPSTLNRAIGALGHDALAGLRALGWEASRIAAASGIDDRAESVLGWALGLSPAAALIVVVAVAGVGLGLTATARRVPREPDGPRHPRTRTPDRRVTQARDLARKGGLALDVARQTALSRDAVTLLARVPSPDGVAGGGRTFRRRLAR